MLIHSLPALPANDPAFNDWFRARWGKENCILWGRTRQADFGPLVHNLSVRAAWGGAERCHIDGRTVAVDDDSFLILNQGQTYSTSIRSEQPVESLAICFGPGLVEQVRNDALASIEQALSRKGNVGTRGYRFFEHLHPHDQWVSPVLRYIRAHLARGHVDEAWHEEQLIFLLARMQIHRRELLERVNALSLRRVSTRREVFRRIGLATDFLHTHYAQEIDLDRLANIAHLSKYHFLRLFTLVHRLTPRAYLQRKRTAVAARLLESTRKTVAEVAASVGFAEESTLLRQMRRWMQLTPYQVRNQSQLSVA
jgi:AraC-like DNA-binding protein